jgi:apolipoprotein N-acyltransferase
MTPPKQQDKSSWRETVLIAALAYACGALGVFSFAPFYAWPLMLLSLVGLFGLWLRASTKKRAVLIGFTWALGLFTVGVPWLFVSLHTYGGMPAWMAALAIFLFCCYLSLWLAFAGWLQAKLQVSAVKRLLIVMPALFVFAEMGRAWFMSGFPWLTVGYTQTPSAFAGFAQFSIAPLSGWAALLGVFGISLWLAKTAGAIMLLSPKLSGVSLTTNAKRALVAALVVVWGGGVLLGSVGWSEPSGKPLPVSLLQGNVAQSMKFREDQLRPTIENYLGLVNDSRGKLIVLPETALPLLLHQISAEVRGELQAKAIANNGDVLLGVAYTQPSNDLRREFDIFNGAISIGKDAPQRYAKSHLVAFGEFTPPMFAWVMQWLNIPLSGFTQGAETQAPMRLSGHLVAVNICYEDAFGRGIAKPFSLTPAPELMVNITNMAWFGETWAADQHAQMSQMRSLEMSRWMLRSTNTGVTAAIDEKGRIVSALPQFTRGVLEVDAVPRTGRTPYSVWTDWPVLLMLVLLIGATVVAHRRG